jgi:peptidoglycan/LPS O-acetylase OafA/YrhL
LVVAWCALWIALATALYDRAADINAWAVARYGPIAEMREPQDIFAAQDSYVRWLLYFSPYLRMGEFVLGSLIAQLYVQLRSRKPGALENTIGTLVLLAAAFSTIPITYLMYSPDVGANIFRKMYMNFGLAPSAALVVFCVARYDNVVSRLLTSRPALILGDASYSIYLTHFLVLMVAFKLIGTVVHGAIFNAVALTLSTLSILLVSVLLYTFYELPARKWLRRLWGAKRPQAALAKT